MYEINFNGKEKVCERERERERGREREIESKCYMFCIDLIVINFLLYYLPIKAARPHKGFLNHIYRHTCRWGDSSYWFESDACVY